MAMEYCRFNSSMSASMRAVAMGSSAEHADARAQVHHIHLARVDVLPVQRDFAGDAAVVDGVVHAVQAAKKRRLAAAGGANHRQHFVAREVQRDIKNRLLVGVSDIDTAAGHDRFGDEWVADGGAVVGGAGWRSRGIGDGGISPPPLNRLRG